MIGGYASWFPAHPAMRYFVLLLFLMILWPCSTIIAQDRGLRFDANMMNTGVSISTVSDLNFNLFPDETNAFYFISAEGDNFTVTGPDQNRIDIDSIALFEVEADQNQSVTVSIDATPNLQFQGGLIQLQNFGFGSTFERERTIVIDNTGAALVSVGFFLQFATAAQLTEGEETEANHIQIEASIE